MNENVKKILSILASGVCNQIDCGQCREIFDCEDGHPCDWVHEKDRVAVVEKFINLLKNDYGEYIDISIEDIIDILKNE